MHHHRKVLRIVQSSCSSSRSAGTSARVKPRSTDDDTPSKTVDLGNWALPSSRSTGTFRTTGSSEHRPGFLSTSPRAGASGAPTGMGKWTPPSRLTDNRPKPQPLPQGSNTTRPNLPGRSLPNKWARSTPTASQEDPTQQPRADSSARANPRLQRDGAPHLSKLQRDAAPHTNPSLVRGTARDTLARLGQRNGAPPFGREQNSDRRNDFSAPPSGSSTGRLQPGLRSHEPTDQSSRPSNRPFESTAAPEPSKSRYTRSDPRQSRTSYKERGTLLSRNHRDGTESDQPAQKQVKIIKKMVVVKKVSPDVYIPSMVSVGTLARLLGVRLESLQKKMRTSGMSEEAEYNHVLTSDYAVLLAEEFGRNPIVNDEAAFDIYPSPPHPNSSTLQSRPPVVTIMGHVDHGKTTLLDNLRSASVAKGEAGGITQHIGAFSVPVPASIESTDGPRSITFLDTPGHAAFSAMRARGAGVTDIVVLVVAADDGIMPQTKEVISLIKKDEGKVGVVVAINKVDKPGVNVDSVQKALLAEDIQLETFGGDIPSVEVSGLTGQGLPTLVETLSAIAEMQDLRAERDGPVQGYVLESKVQRGLGPVATVLVLRGCLQPGTHVISGLSQAKVRVMNDSTGATVKAAYPGMAVTVSGWKTVPNAGDEVLQGTEAEVKKAIANRERKAEIESTLLDVEAINASRREEREKRILELELGETQKAAPTQDEQGPKELRLIIKADVSGSAEAVQGALQGIGNKEAITRVMSAGVGDISESDVMMAKAVGGVLVGFSVKTPRAMETLAAQNGIPIISSDIIYRLMEIVKEKVIALLPVIIETRVTGEATILALFDIQLKAKQTKRVAGCRVTNGIVEKAKFARLVRNGTVLHEGSLDTMRILKKDVTEIRKGTECGLCFGPTFGDLQEGDIIQMYEKIEKPGVL